MKKKIFHWLCRVILGIALLLQPGPMTAQAAAPIQPQWLQTSQPDTGNIANAHFGAAVAQSQDGSVMALGADAEPVAANAAQGVVHVIRYSAGVAHPYTLQANDGAAGDHFGISVAVSADGSTILAGAYLADISANANQGAAYVFTWSGSAWTQQAKLTAATGTANEYVGSAVALNSDGSTALVGAVGFTNNQSQQGGAFVFIRSGTTWSQQGSNPLLAFDAVANDWMGNTVALSSDGNTALVGASGKASNQGAAYVYSRSGAFWTLQHKFLAWDGAAGDDFARSAALSSDGNTALISADNAAVNGNSVQGAAYTYKRTGSSWSNGVKLISADGAAGDVFGYSVSLSLDGSTAVIGAPQATVNLSLTQGAAYIFFGGSFAQQQKLISNNAKQNDNFGAAVSANGSGTTFWVGSPNLTWGTTHQGGVYRFDEYAAKWWQQFTQSNSAGPANDYFGYTLAASSDGNTALVGAVNQNTAFVYTRVNNTWSLQASIPSNDPNSVDLGAAVALSADGNTALLGAWQASVNGNHHQGAAYLSTRSGSTWSAPTRIVASDGAASDQFGVAVALSADGSTAAISAYGTNFSKGSVYVMTRSGPGWSALTRIDAGDSAIYDYFGNSIALSSNGSTLLVGALNATNGTLTTGAAYVFTRSAGVYSLEKRLAPASGYATTAFGNAVALSGDGNTAIIGAPFKGAGQINGAAYVYTRSAGTWSEPTIITAIDNFSSDHFGESLGISTDGNTAVVGATLALVYGQPNGGAAYVYRKSGAAWTLQKKLTVWDTIPTYLNGAGVAISGDGHTVLQGGNAKDNYRGAIYFFVENPSFPVFVPMVKK